ncbi:MAG: diguanylate cyclase [Gammaproteobacteria bacterium]|nr:diguanylate cyclase [Gammaproteobacteria bacterium]
MTVSVGVTMLRSTDTPQTLIERADEALYLSKENGRNRISVR